MQSDIDLFHRPYDSDVSRYMPLLKKTGNMQRMARKEKQKMW